MCFGLCLSDYRETKNAMSNIKSLSHTLQHAVKVEVVSSCVWSHTEPYAHIFDFVSGDKFTKAALHVASMNDYQFASIFVTTKDESGWSFRFDITKKELVRLAAYEFVKTLPARIAKVYGVHSSGFSRLKSDEFNAENAKMTEAFTMDFHREVEQGITEFRIESCSKDDPIVESSTAADSFDPIDDTKKNS